MGHSEQDEIAVEDRRIESNRATARDDERKNDQKANSEIATAREVIRVVDQKMVSKNILATQNLSLLVIVMLGVNTILSTLTFIDYSLAHNTAVTERRQIINDVELLKASRVDQGTFEKKLLEINDKTDKLMLLGAEVAKRQTINEANIEINHAMLKKMAESLPATQPIKIPDPLPLPDK